MQHFYRFIVVTASGEPCRYRLCQGYVSLEPTVRHLGQPPVPGSRAASLGLCAHTTKQFAATLELRYVWKEEAKNCTTPTGLLAAANGAAA